MKTVKQMFGQIANEMRAAAERDYLELASRQHAADEAEARLDAPLTRRDVLDAIRDVRDRFGGSGEPIQEVVYDAFDRLLDALS